VAAWFEVANEFARPQIDLVGGLDRNKYGGLRGITVA